MMRLMIRRHYSELLSASLESLSKLGSFNCTGNLRNRIAMKPVATLFSRVIRSY